LLPVTHDISPDVSGDRSADSSGRARPGEFLTLIQANITT
jgi:hypothetical protein